VRAAVAGFGLVLALVGAVLWYVPVTTASSSTPVPVGDAFDFSVPGTLIIGPVPFTATWTASGPTNVTLYGCGSDAKCSAQTNSSVIARGAGTTGSMKWTGKAGLYYLFVPDASTNVTISYGEPLLGGLGGLAVLGVGIVVLVAGIAMRRSPGSPRTPASPG
jgi:hypothetical protein